MENCEYIRPCKCFACRSHNAEVQRRRRAPLTGLQVFCLVALAILPVTVFIVMLVAVAAAQG